MALIACSECNAEVSDRATACPRCGNPIAATQHQEPPKRSGRLGVGLGIVGLVGIFVIAATISANSSRSSTSATADATTGNELGIKADDVVKMDKASFGCEFEHKFAEAAEHYNQKEYSAWARIVNDAPWCFSGGALNPEQTWTVLQVRGRIMQISQTTLAQYKLDPSRHKHSYWTATFWATKATDPKP
ncbi:zinc-ribbon domain-containing protein [Cupriavidus malaysiensis]|uniref:zinc-ribbon domain-containing protein n=1 Tax=Cupriavidus malaysiensis TaxID=367825 RepID=UPI000A04D421|nr:zinc-ribbon domain-containing protein [Cupriavidus malaysiensis]